MVKKILGVLFFVAAILLLIGYIANGTFFIDMGSTAATCGYFIGTMLPVVLYVLSGIFLLTFDNPTKTNYIDGFKKRSKQAVIIIVLTIVYGILMYIVAVGSATAGIRGSLPVIISTILISMLPYFIPLEIFVCMWLMYARPHRMSKKYFLYSDVTLHQYLSADETFHAYSNDNTVLASDKVLFFPTFFCAIPFEQIASTKLVKQLWERDVYFNLSNGKKFYIVIKHYDRIQEAINANQQT